MRAGLILSLLLLAAPPSRGDERAVLPVGATPESEPDKPAPQLISLEQLLSQTQSAHDDGTLKPEQYQAFVAKFRANLDRAMTLVPQTPANKGLHAQILSRLGADERGQALSGLAQALESNPSDPELLRARGNILYEQRDFPAAAESARQAWEASGHKDKAAWALLKMSEGRVAAGFGSSVPALPASEYTANEWTIPKNHDISSQAMGFVQKSIAARGRGDMAATWANAQAAMNADPKSIAVQKFYETVKADKTQNIETKSYIEQAVTALGAGRGDEAVSWAQKAYERSPKEDTKFVLEDVRRRSAELGTKNAHSPAKDPTPRRGSPLLPLLAAGGAGLTALGLYKVALSRGTESSENGLNPSPEVSLEQSRRNYLNSAVLIGTPVVIAALVYGGPIAWRAIAPAAARALRGGQQSFQRVATSQAGAILPEEQAAGQRVSAMQKLPWNSWAQYPKELVNGREYAKTGGRLYTEHAVERMLPSGLTAGNAVDGGRSMSPTFVEDVIVRGMQTTDVRNGVLRTFHRLGTTEVITEDGGKIVVTVNPFKFK